MIRALLRALFPHPELFFLVTMVLYGAASIGFHLHGNMHGAVWFLVATILGAIGARLARRG